MKTKLNVEELKYNLPDYVSNSISDEGLIAEIENELKVNSELRADLAELKSTFGFLETSKFEAPPNNYFANLPVKINERIYANETTTSFLERLSLFWKILIPAIPVIILIAILLFNSSKNDSNKIQTTNTDPIQKESPQKKIESVENKNNAVNEVQGNDSRENVPLKKIMKQDNSLSKMTRKLQKNDLTKNPNTIKGHETVEIPEIKAQLGELLADNREIIEDSNSEEEVDVMYSGEDDESEVESLDNEFLELTPEQQKEIIDNLLKSQI